MLQVNNLKLYYKTLKGYVKALDDVTFDIKDNEILGVAGESGCGKSTLGNGLILLKPPLNYRGGEVILDSEKLDIQDYEKMRNIRFSKISIIPQYAMDALNPTRKIGKYIQDVFKSKGLNFDDYKDRVIERIEMVGLEKKVLNMYPIELSGGMKQRMVMVISTLLNPSLLIADEVTSALDVSSQKSVSKMIKRFKDEKIVKSIMFITHDLTVLYQISDRIMILYAGQVAEIGPTEEIVKNGRHPYTKMLISALPEIGIRYEKEKLHGIYGQPPNLLTPPEGCRFKERCPFRMDSCDKLPPKTQISEDHVVYCWKVSQNA